MPAMKSYINAFMLTTMMIVVSGCMPKATEKKAVCGANEVFSSVTRSCSSIEEVRHTPTGTLNTETLLEETPKNIILAYSDGNNNQAISCKVSGLSSNIEAISPLLLSGGFFTVADDIYSMAYNMRIQMPVDAAASSAEAAMLAALNTAKGSFYYTTVLTQVGIFTSQLDILLSLAQASLVNPAVQNYYTLIQQRLLDFDPMVTQLTNRCECSAGVCTTTIIPKLNKSGSAGFSYAITDLDGEGVSKGVSLSITAMSGSTTHLKPTAESAYLAVSESATSTASSYSVTLPGAADLAGTAAGTFRYYFNGSKNGSNKGLTSNGTVYNCMDLTGSTGLNDTTCTYTPDNGDDNEANVVAKAFAVIGDLTFTARSEGVVGNNFSIQYFNLQDNNLGIDPYVSETETFGLISSTYGESFVRVVGDAIKVFINPNVTTSNHIKSLLNAHPQASRLVVVTGGSGAFPVPSVLTPAAVTLAGGVDGYDSIPYLANNLLTNSSNTASFMLSMAAVNDPPMVPKVYNSLFSQNETFLEEEIKTVTLDFTDVDSHTSAVTLSVKVDTVTPSCSSLMTNAAFLLLGSSANFTLTIPAPGVATCDLAGTCSQDITVESNLDFAGSACLYYTVTDISGAVSSVQSVNISVTGVNDAPTVAAIADTSVNEDLAVAPPLPSYTDATIGTGGDVYEAGQKLTVTASSSNTTLIPNVSCQNYTPGAGTPVGAIVPSASGIYFFDTTNYTCYVSTGTALATDWKIHPSLTAYPNCAYDYYGMGSPVSVVTPSSSGKYYLDTTNNKCYKSASASSSSWAQDTTLTNYKIAYVPHKDKSGIANITVTVQDDGGTANSGVDTASDVFQLTVNSIDDAPYFITSVTSIQTNEGGAVQSDAFLVDEDEGSTTDEDVQAMSISNLTTDNASVLPTTAISIFYDLNDNGIEDTGEDRAVGAMLEDVIGDDAKLHKFYLKLDPVDGVSGNANITLTISDGNSTTQKMLSLVVYPIAANHGGWDNLSSVGLKTDKNGGPVSEAELKCNYNKSTDTEKCGTSSCTGTSSPHSVVVPTAANVLYWDSANKRCYRSASASEFAWVDIQTACPITRQSGVCSDNNCIVSASPVGVTIPTIVDQYMYDPNTKTCYRSTATETNADWETFVPSKVTLAWKPFTLVSSGAESGAQIAGWNVYRREAGADYDFNGGHLQDSSSTSTYTIVGPSVRTFTDTTANAGKVYYYVVRPVENRRNFPTYTGEIFSEVRVLAAPQNYAFVHRWIVNQEICNGMNFTTETTPYFINTSKNFRCQYSGPGMITDGSDNYYDYGKDLLVDSQELGCPYAAAPKCTANGCVGIGDPSVTAGIAINDLYYDREAGVCHRFDGAAWQTFDSAFVITSTLAKSLKSALNAPLVNIKQARAVEVCSATTAPAGTDLLASFTAKTASLPDKKDFMAYSSHPFGMTDTAITEMEQGFSLNVQSRCNGSSASGLETAYTNTAIPSTSLIYSLPGTAASGIKSLYTGSIAWGSSKGTEGCISRFGIQDLYGNVAEWTKDKIECSTADFACTAVAGSSYASYDFDPDTVGLQPYGFDFASGPFNEVNTAIPGPDTLDTYLTNWVFADELFGAGKFLSPLALPINDDIQAVLPNSTSLDWLLDIGPSSGITTNKLHEDGIIINGADIDADVSNQGAFAVGGSYLSGNLAGRYTSELIPTAGARSDVGLRCIIPIDEIDYDVDPLHNYPY